MHVGMGVIFQGQGEGRTDRNVYRNELRFGDLAEPLGFDSLWGVEHHFTDYTMCPDVLQYLTYFAGRTYAAAVSPESAEIMAKLGIGILIIPQKPWDVTVKELNDYRSVFSRVNGIDAPPPIVAGWTLCDTNPDRAEEHARKYIGEYYQSVIRHYELIGDHLTKMRGYEAYKAVQEGITPGGVDEGVR